MIRIGVIGDYDGRVSHLATNEAIAHCAAYLGLEQETEWIATNCLENHNNGSINNDNSQSLNRFDALWCAPGSPYKSAQGAMNGIQFARENNIPFIGTCGGFQHVVLEFARDIEGVSVLNENDFDPYSPNLFISALSCSLVGETRNIFLTKDTMVAQIYNKQHTEERYNCNFGLNNNFRSQMQAYGYVTAGSDEDGNTRIFELPKNNFFVATLFQPQLSSTPEHPHPLIVAYLKSVEKFRPYKNQI
jgi:CTP synthase (UTP-ammonia lyase)